MIGLKNANDYSQFHFGAGEASVIEMVSKIEDASDGAMVLIEELENGLHPLAVEKMVEYLFEVAKRKKCQVIFTTHSEYSLRLLPPPAIWACIDGNAYNGKLSIESLRALIGTVNKNCVIFVEDEFAKDLCEEMLRQLAGDAMHRIEVHKAGGFPHVVDVLKFHNDDPTVKRKAVALIDGDNPDTYDDNEFVFRLPEHTPESLVFGWIYQNIKDVAALVQQRCQCPSIKQDQIVELVCQVMIDTTDHHLYFSKLGELIGFQSEMIVRRGLCSIYVERNKQTLRTIIDGILSRFPV